MCRVDPLTDVRIRLAARTLQGRDGLRSTDEAECGRDLPAYERAGIAEPRRDSADVGRPSSTRYASASSLLSRSARASSTRVTPSRPADASANAIATRTRLSFSETIAASMRGAAAAAPPERASPCTPPSVGGIPGRGLRFEQCNLRRLTDCRERADRGAARHPAYVERELIRQRRNGLFVPEIAKRTHRREPDVERFVVDPTDERDAGALHPQATERSGRRHPHRRLTVAE